MDITLHYEPGYGWKPSFRGVVNGRTFSYNGEYQITPQEALARAVKALDTYNIMDLAS